MHIPDGTLGPKTFLTCFALVAPFWWAGYRRLSQAYARGDDRLMPDLALGSAFAFVLMMFNVPIPGGTSGHAVGAAFLAIILGFRETVLALSVALLFQAVVFGDGGLTAYGANCLNMAVIQGGIGAALWHLLGPGKPARSLTHTAVAAFGAGYLSTVVSATVTGFQLGLQPLLERSPAGLPNYYPFGLTITVPAMAISHAYIGLLEGALTALVVIALVRGSATAAGRAALDGLQVPTANRALLLNKSTLWIAMGVAAFATPLGLWLPERFNAAEPFGEESPEQIAQAARLPDVPTGMKKLGTLYAAPMPDYGGEMEHLKVPVTARYTGSAFLGIALCTGLFLGVGAVQSMRSRRRLAPVFPGPGSPLEPSSENEDITR